MVSVSLIQRCFDSGEFEKLARMLGANGLPYPLPLQARLGFAAPATGLALKRVVDLTYGPTALSRTMAATLRHLQRPDGSFAGSGDRDPVATAAAAAGWAAMLAEPTFRADNTIQHAHDRAVAALASMQDGSGLFTCADDRTWQDRAMAAAFVLVVLAADEGFRETVRFNDLMSWFDEHQDRLDATTAELYRLAQARRPAAIEQTLALAAIAA